jgi:hypothetical protein
LEVVRPYRGSQYLDGRSGAGYRRVALLPPDAGEMEPDILYTCLLSEALLRNAEAPGHTYLCVRDRITDDEEEMGLLRGMIVVNENRSVAWLFNLMQTYLLSLADWERDMQRALLDGGGYQQLLDLCEPILKNFVLAVDASYKLLAYTKNIPNIDPINIALIEKGYHTEETLQKFKRLKRFELYEKETGLIFSGPGEISRFECVSKWCRFGGEPLLHAVMVCSQTPLSPAITELFDVLMEYIDRLFVREQRLHPAEIYSSLLYDMLYVGLDGPFAIAERAKVSDVPFTGFFNAYRIVFEDNATVLVGRFVQDLSSYLPSSWIIAHNYEVSVLNAYPSADVRKHSGVNLSRLLPLFEKYGVLCGVSESFFALPDFKNACIQATRAQTLGAQLRASENSWGFDKDVFEAARRARGGGGYHYDDIYIYLMLHIAQSGAFDVLSNAHYNRALDSLLTYDKTNGTRLVQILYAFLICERHATAAGRILHMHRNNVLYHISRTEEILGADLSDYWTRLKLMLAYHFFELQASNRTFIFPEDGGRRSHRA